MQDEDEADRNESGILYKTSNLFSEVARSNLYTMHIASERDARQKLPSVPGMPDASTRRLRARLILEEALETIDALGCSVFDAHNTPVKMENVTFVVSDSCGGDPLLDALKGNLEDAIDGCCDLIYVAVGTLCAMGVPDLPHLHEVNRANNAKFVGGVGITDVNGKFQKPARWRKPCHMDVINSMRQPDLALAARQTVELVRAKETE